MLAYVLALIIGFGSIALYMTGFFFPEVHRKQDFIWSGVGLFYAWVLWVCAGRITGGVLLGQLASVVLLGWFAWQTLTLRRALAAPEQQTPIPAELPSSFSGLLSKFTGLFKKGKSDREIVESAKAAAKLKDVVRSAPVAEVEIIDKRDTPATTPTSDQEIIDKGATASQASELVPPKPPTPTMVEAAQKTSEIDAPEAETIPVEAIAPEVELAPPAEPTGRGDPKDRIVESETTNSPKIENPDQSA